MQFIGQQPILSFFDLAVKNQQLAHAYCFVGPSQIGKRTLANVLAAKILGVELDGLSVNPDYYYIQRLEDEKTGKKKKEISVEQARVLKEKMMNHSWMNGYKVAVLDEADLLNEESGNALLKIIEEPPAKSIIFLLTEDDTKILSTIRSRCQIINFSSVSSLEIENYLRTVVENKDTIDQIVKLSWGRPGRAIDLSKNIELFENCLKEKKRWEKIIESSVHERWQAMDDLLSEKGGLIKTKEKLDPVLDFWMMLWRAKMLEETDYSQKYGRIIDDIKKTKNILAANVNPRLAVEEFLTKF